MGEWENKRSIGRFRYFYRWRSRRALQSIMSILLSKYSLFAVLKCILGTNSNITEQINLVTSCMSVGSDLAAERASVSLKLREENQTCLKEPPKVALAIWMSFCMLLATSYRKGTFCAAERRELGAYFTVCFWARVQWGPIAECGVNAEQNMLLWNGHNVVQKKSVMLPFSLYFNGSVRGSTEALFCLR